jgi:hypothetical protein
MDRVPADILSLAEVARFWSRDPHTIFAQAEIADLLIQAIWRGDLAVTSPAGHNPRAGDYRQSLLLAVAGIRTHPGLLFIRPGDDVRPAETDLPDGGALIDLRERISWTADGVEPSDATTQAAFAKLASVELDAYDEAVVGPILLGLPIDRDALRAFCESSGFPLPKFWFPKGPPTRRTASAERQCEKWLEDLARQGGKPGSKRALEREALTKFTGLSGAAFGRAWQKAAPPAWKGPGAPTKPTRRKR